MTNPLPEQMPSFETFPFFNTVDTLPKKDPYTEAVLKFQETVKEAFSRQAEEIKFLKERIVFLEQQVTTLTATYEAKIQSQEVAASACNGYLRWRVERLIHQRDELVKIAKKAPQTVSKAIQEYGEETGSKGVKFTHRSVEILIPQINWEPYYREVDLLVHPKKI